MAQRRWPKFWKSVRDVLPSNGIPHRPLTGRPTPATHALIRLVHERPHPLQHVQCLEVLGEHDRAAGAVVQAMNWVDRRIIRDLIHEAGLAPSMGGDARFFENHKVVFVGIQNVHDRVLFLADKFEKNIVVFII